jgi:hydrogenase expression/formation protein HypD
MCVRQLEESRFGVENQYKRSVRREGNVAARKAMEDVFEVVDRGWRGVGVIPKSGYGLRRDYAGYDAEIRFDVEQIDAEEDSECISGLILQGIRKPAECPAFGARCTPEQPLETTMVSSEGACAAYYRYRKVSPR